MDASDLSWPGIIAGLVFVGVEMLGAALGPSDDVSLPGGVWKSGPMEYRLQYVVWKPETNEVSGDVVFRMDGRFALMRAPAFELGTYDPGKQPLEIERHRLSLEPVLDESGRRLTWSFDRFRVPPGEKFAGVYLSDGSYVPEGATEPEPLFVTLATAFDTG